MSVKYELKINYSGPAVYVGDQSDLIYDRFGNEFSTISHLNENTKVATILFTSSSRITIGDIPFTKGIDLKNVTLTEV